MQEELKQFWETISGLMGESKLPDAILLLPNERPWGIPQGLVKSGIRFGAYFTVYHLRCSRRSRCNVLYRQDRLLNGICRLPNWR